MTMLESVATALKRPTSVSRDAEGGVTQNYTTVWTNRPCSLQEASSSKQTYYAQLSIAVSTTIYFASDPGVQVNDYITVTDQSGTPQGTYLVQGLNHPVGRGRAPWNCDCQRIAAPS